MKKETIKYLLSEEKQAFKGWDFSYLNGRWESDELPWSYEEFVRKYLNTDSVILDMGTGGGELLLSFNHPFELTSVTESYEPNINLCFKTLSPKGIMVYPIKEDDILEGVPSFKFDIVLNRHESFNVSEVKRILKNNGVFITQQLGAFNNFDLATFFDPNHKSQYPDLTLDKTVEKLENSGFKILYKNEFFPELKFYDLGAVAYFAKIINWEFLNFSVINYLDKFENLELILKRNGFIKSTEHRFIIIARKQNID